MRKLISIVLGMLFLVGCVPPATPSTATTATSQTTVRQDASSLSGEELQRYEQAFTASLAFFNWNAQALVSVYDCPENLNLAEFFWNGIGTQVLTNKEEEFIRQAKIDPGYDIARIDVAKANVVLERCFGITWEETNGVGLDNLLYNKKENCYYLAANGTNGFSLAVIHSGTHNEDGSVSLTYSRPYLDLEYVVTFFEEESSDGICYRFVSNIRKGTSLSEEELQHYEQAFAASFEPFNWNAQALVSVYDCPENLNLAEFFWNGIGTQVLTDEEEEFIRQAKIDPGYDIARIDVAKANVVLERCFGITWEEANGVGLDRLPYNEKENCYYLAANGTNGFSLSVIHSGTRNEDGSVSLTYSHGVLEYVVTFFEEESSDGVRYRFVSNIRKGTSLSGEELQHYEQAFAASFEPFNWNAQALVSVYDCPKNLNLAEFFWNGIGTQVLTDEEEEFIRQAKIDPGYDIARIDVAEANAVLERCFGITWEETNGVGLDRLPYNEKENCCYMAANGPLFLYDLKIHSGTRNEDGSVSLTYSHGILEYVVTFFEEESSDGVRYRFISNLKVE